MRNCRLTRSIQQFETQHLSSALLWKRGIQALRTTCFQRQPGELSYFIPDSEWSAADRGQEISIAYEGGLTALLYVHRIVLNSPLLMLSSAFTRGKPLEWCRDLLFTSLHRLRSLKELIDAGVVVIIGSDANYYSASAENALIERVGQSTFDNLDYKLRRNIELSLASGCAIDLFASNDAEYSQLQKVFGEDGKCALASRSDAVYLSTLLEEVVPDATELDLREVVRIREDDSFEQWRTDLRTAIRRMTIINRAGGLVGEGIEEVQVLMHEKAASINKAVATSGSMVGLRKDIASFAVGGVGAVSVIPIVGQANVVSEVAMLGGSLGVGALLIGGAAVANWLRNPQAGIQALAHHYAFVAKCAKR